MKSLKVYAAVLLTGLLFANGYGQQLRGDWKLIEMKADGKIIDIVNDKAPTLNFIAKNSFRGNSGCNNYLAGYKIQNKKIKIKPGLMTVMGCPAERVRTQERSFLEMFKKLEKFAITAKLFTLYSSDSRYALKFVRYHPNADSSK